MTPPERRLWQALRNSRLGVRFRRQHPLGVFIADFYCHAASLVVEVDGGSHRGERREHDVVRDRWMRERGLDVLRVRAVDVRDNVEGVVRTIERRARERTPNPPPASRGDATSPAGRGGGEPDAGRL